MMRRRWPTLISKSSTSLTHRTHRCSKLKPYKGSVMMKKLLCQSTHSLRSAQSTLVIKVRRQRPIKTSTSIKAASKKRLSETSLTIQGRSLWPKSPSTRKVRKLNYSESTSSWRKTSLMRARRRFRKIRRSMRSSKWTCRPSHSRQKRT